MTISPVLIIGVAVAIAIGVIIWGIISVRSEKDIIEERLSRIEDANMSYLDLEDTSEEQVHREETERDPAAARLAGLGTNFRQEVATRSFRAPTSS